MSLVRAAACCTLAIFATLAGAEGGIVLAPGKTVAVIDAGDPLIRVMVTAPADQPLDLTPLLYSLAPGDSVYSIVTRMQVKEAAGLVENADGSLSLGAAPASASVPAATISGGTLVILERGRYAHYKDDTPAAGLQTASKQGDERARGTPEVPLPARAGGPTPAQPVTATMPTLPVATAPLPIPGTVTLTVVQTTGSGTVNFSSFNIGSGSTVNLSQPSASSTALTGTTSVQGQVFGRITTTGSTTPGGNVSVK